MSRKNEELIKRHKKVGEGGFGVVYFGSYREYREVGIKDIKGQLSDEALTEANILKRLTHPNIIQYIDIVQTRNQTSLIMEFVDGGSLCGYIERTTQSSAYWKTARRIMMDVAHGMSYLHGERIVHADLKSPNILLRHNYDAVICDFGLARTIVDSRAATTGFSSGTELWFAPELCFDRPERSSFSSDVWAFGCTLLEIISQKYPWEDVYHHDKVLLNALSKRENAIIFENICLTQKAPEKLRAILCHCCAWEKTERPNFPAIVRDLSAISDGDLQNVNQGKAKPSSSNSENVEPSTSTKRSSAKKSSKANNQDVDNVAASLAKCKLENPSPQRKSSAKPPTDNSGKQPANEDMMYDAEHDRYLYKGPRGGWYYLSASGNKIYSKND